MQTTGRSAGAGWVGRGEALKKRRETPACIERPGRQVSPEKLRPAHPPPCAVTSGQQVSDQGGGEAASEGRARARVCVRAHAHRPPERPGARGAGG